MVHAAHPHPPENYWVVALLAPLFVVATCLAVLAFDLAGLASQPPAALAPSQVVSLCISLRLSSDWRAAIWWGSAVSTRTGRVRRPFVQPRLACGLIPWQPWLPATGALETSD